MRMHQKREVQGLLLLWLAVVAIAFLSGFWLFIFLSLAGLPFILLFLDICSSSCRKEERMFREQKELWEPLSTPISNGNGRTSRKKIRDMPPK